MGLSAGSVTIGLGADYGGLSRDLSKAQRELSRFGKSASQALAPIMMGANMFGGNQLVSDITRATAAMWGFAAAIKAASVAFTVSGGILSQSGSIGKLFRMQSKGGKSVAEEIRKVFREKEDAPVVDAQFRGRAYQREYMNAQLGGGTSLSRRYVNVRRGQRLLEGSSGIVPYNAAADWINRNTGTRRPGVTIDSTPGKSINANVTRGSAELIANAVKRFPIKPLGIGLGASAAGMLAAGGLASVAADRVAKERQLAESLRMTDSSLRSMNLAARKSGVEEQKVAEMLSKVATVSSQAAMGMGEAQKAFQMLGLDAKKIAGMGADEQLYAVTERLRSMSDQTARAGIAAKIFGESAGRSLSFLMGLEAGAKKDSWIQSFGETGRNSLMAMIPSWESFTEKMSVIVNNMMGVSSALWRIGGEGMQGLASTFLFLTDAAVKLVSSFAELVEWQKNITTEAFNGAAKWAKGKMGLGDIDISAEISNAYNNLFAWLNEKLGLGGKAPTESQKGAVSPVDMFQQKEIGSSTIVNRSLIDVSGYAAQTIAAKQLSVLEQIAQNTAKGQAAGTGAVLATR